MRGADKFASREATAECLFPNGSLRLHMEDPISGQELASFGLGQWSENRPVRR